ncbi:uncharacterized protein KRP23_8112 [Phytophthora ramorum]|uniref:uncharacterized protein n=1 Tax=Phytophthora ramorum TaxID=164328 RepID=UPI0030A859CD|nr:hypothetical protein KRP23_8112 [Phytophthora ramorum]
MSIAAELGCTTASLAALCRRSFGPCGEQTLLFRPAEAPVVTGEGHAVLTAWKQGLDADDPLATFLLTAANGVHKQLGDGSSEFILLLDAAMRHAVERLRREQDARSGVDRARLSRAFAELKWELQQEMQATQSDLSRLKIAVPIELNRETMHPSKQFREASAAILISGLRGMEAHPVMLSLVTQ